MPGLLQTPEFTRARIEADRQMGSGGFTIDKAVEGRLGRQRMLRRPDGPLYEVVLDEVAIRRRAAPPEVLKAQLYHLTATVNVDPRVTLRVLPVDAEIKGYSVPRSAFSIYTFADPGDPNVVVADTVTDDLVLTEDDDVNRYVELFNRLRQASLPEANSLHLLIETAQEIHLCRGDSAGARHPSSRLVSPPPFWALDPAPERPIQHPERGSQDTL